MNSSATDTPAVTAEPGSGLGMFGLLEVARGLEERVNQALETIGLSISKYLTLRSLVNAQGSMSLSTLADCRKCVRSNITQAVDRLVTDGLVERVNDPADRRTIYARITSLGSERFAAATAAMQSIEQESLARLSPDDRATFIRVLAALRNS